MPQDTPRQIDLFMNVERIEKLEKLDLCIETIRQRFGKDSIKNAVLCQNLRLPPEKAEITMPTGRLKLGGCDEQHRSIGQTRSLRVYGDSSVVTGMRKQIASSA